ncbi:MAG: hypothetical protein AB8F94_15590 [Saprospiraceae bacterium]
MKYLPSVFVIVLFFCCTSSCSEGKKMTNTVVKNEIVATLRGKVKPQQVVAAFQKYKMETVKSIDKNTNTWMFTFDKTLIDPDEFINSLQDSQFIKSAKFGER